MCLKPYLEVFRPFIKLLLEKENCHEKKGRAEGEEEVKS